MVISGTPSPILVSQKRLTILVVVIGLLGCLVLGLVWRDSLENFTEYRSDKYTIFLGHSVVVYESHQFLTHVGFKRGSLKTYSLGGLPLLTLPDFSSSFIRIPIYLLILAYLATLLLIWLVLMNRLARRHFKNTTSTPTQD